MSEANLEPNKFLANLENSMQSKTFCLLATFTLMVDSALIAIHKHGLIFYVVQPEQIKWGFGLELFLLYVCFSFLMSFVLPIATYIVSEFAFLFCEIGSGVMSPLIRMLSFSNNDSYEEDAATRPWDCVLMLELRKKAFDTMDPCYLNLYQKENEKYHNTERNQFFLRSVATATLLAALWNFIMYPDLGLLGNVANFFGSVFYIFGLFVIIGLVAFSHLTFPYKIRWIECPSLANELREKRIKNKLTTYTPD